MNRRDLNEINRTLEASGFLGCLYPADEDTGQFDRYVPVCGCVTLSHKGEDPLTFFSLFNGDRIGFRSATLEPNGAVVLGDCDYRGFGRPVKVSAFKFVPSPIGEDHPLYKELRLMWLKKGGLLYPLSFRRFAHGWSFLPSAQEAITKAILGSKKDLEFVPLGFDELTANVPRMEH